MPAKPTKYGIKVWMAAISSNGYVLNFDVYLGKEVVGRRRIYGLGYDVVTKLIRPYMNRNHHVFFDNFFTPTKLLEHLEANDTYACGTVRCNRKDLHVRQVVFLNCYKFYFHVHIEIKTAVVEGASGNVQHSTSCLEWTRKQTDFHHQKYLELLMAVGLKEWEGEQQLTEWLQQRYLRRFRAGSKNSPSLFDTVFNCSNVGVSQ